jgi:hypothetical protein
LIKMENVVFFGSRAMRWCTLQNCVFRIIFLQKCKMTKREFN